MLLTNHALTGIWLGSVIDQPVLGFPAGVASHLILDSTPHALWMPGPFRYTYPKTDNPGLPHFKEPRGFIIGSLDFAGALTILGVGLFIFPQRRGQIVAGWLGAVGPDLLYLPEIFFHRRFFARFKRFHSNIQWSESPYGIITEVIWALLMLRLLKLI